MNPTTKTLDSLLDEQQTRILNPIEQSGGKYLESSAHRHSPQELAERAAIIFALKVASRKRSEE